jgi:hypothetical protein
MLYGIVSGCPTPFGAATWIVSVAHDSRTERPAAKDDLGPVSAIENAAHSVGE